MEVAPREFWGEKNRKAAITNVSCRIVRTPTQETMQALKPKQRHFARISRRGALPLLTLGLTFSVWFTSNRDWGRYSEATHLAEHTYQVLAAVETLRSSIEDAETSQRGYLLTGEQRYLARYRIALSSAIGSHATLRQ